MQELILKNILPLTDMDSASTVKLCDQWFNGDYNRIVEAIQNFSKESKFSGNELSY